jgi:hypothetical protein
MKRALQVFHVKFERCIKEASVVQIFKDMNTFQSHKSNRNKFKSYFKKIDWFYM